MLEKKTMNDLYKFETTLKLLEYTLKDILTYKKEQCISLGCDSIDIKGAFVPIFGFETEERKKRAIECIAKIWDLNVKLSDFPYQRFIYTSYRLAQNNIWIKENGAWRK